jgi:cobalamin biosynthesis protein CobT
MIMYLDKSSCEARFAELAQQKTVNMGATRASLIRLLKSLDLVSWSNHEESGRLDRRAFTRFAVGDKNIFSRREVSEATTSAVSMLIDCSGSMNDNAEIITAQEIAVQLARLLDRANCEYSVTGFYGSQSGTMIQGSGALPMASTAIPTEFVTFIPFKLWNESLQRAAAKLGSMHQWARASTPDYSAIMTKLEELAWRKEDRKILFLLTDACGYFPEHMKHLQRFADKHGIKLVVIGIGSTQVESIFTNAVNVRNLQALASTAFNKLLATVK